MWAPKQDEGVETYADYLTGRHGRLAYQYALKTADKLQRNGDIEGYTAWSRVAAAVGCKVRKRREEICRTAVGNGRRAYR